MIDFHKIKKDRLSESERIVYSLYDSVQIYKCTEYKHWIILMNGDTYLCEINLFNKHSNWSSDDPLVSVRFNDDVFNSKLKNIISDCINITIKTIGYRNFSQHWSNKKLKLIKNN